MEVHNDRGFAQKDASIASAVLYTLMPPGSLIVVPDSIWTHELWAAQLLGAALRGCRVYVIAPAQANAPSAGLPAAVAHARDLEPLHRGPADPGPRDRRARRTPARGALHPGRRRRRPRGAPRRDAPDLRALSVPEGGLPVPRGVLRPRRQGAGAARRRPATCPPTTGCRRTRAPARPRCTGRPSSSSRATRSRRSCATSGPRTSSSTRRGSSPGRGSSSSPRSWRRPGSTSGRSSARTSTSSGTCPQPVREKPILYMTVGSLNKDARGMMTDGEVLQVTAGAVGDVGGGGHVDPHRVDHLDREPGGARPAAAALQAVAAAHGPLGAKGDLSS